MRKFFSVWLILLVIAVFAAVLLVSFPLLTVRAQQTASDDLNVLLDAAFTRISLAEATAETVAASEDENILGKARAVDRFLSHDDALLQTDALVVLCDMLNVSAIDVTDMDGAIVASSVAGRIGRSLVDDPKTAWTQEVLEGENLSRTLVDEDNAAMLSGCVSRTDAEGLVYIRSLDVAIMEAMTAATPEQVLLDMSFIKDTLVVPDAEGTVDSDGSGYVVTRTKDGVTLSAMRPFSQVYAVRSAVLFVEAIGFLLCMLFAAVIQSMLIKKRLASRGEAVNALASEPTEPETPYDETDEPVLGSDAEEASYAYEEPGVREQEAWEADPDAEHADAPEPAPEPDADTRKKARRKARKPRKKLFEFVDVVEEIEVPDEAPADAETETETEAETVAAVLEDALVAPPPEEPEIIAEAAREFAAPEAVVAEPVEEEAPARRRGGQRKAQREAEAAPRPRRKRGREAPVDEDGAFDKIFD